VDRRRNHLSKTAISEVLNVISRSPNTLQPARLCAADFAVFFGLQDGKCRIGATNAEADFIKVARENPVVPTRKSCTGRAVLERCTVHVLDGHHSLRFGAIPYLPPRPSLAALAWSLCQATNDGF
jgi:hypothetical protein